MGTTTLGVVFWAVMVALAPHHVRAGWQNDVKPLRILTLDDNEVFKFLGNTTHDDHFKVVLPMSDSHILVGGRNIIYTLSINDLAVINRFEWHPAPMGWRSCYLKGGSEDDCENYIRVLTRKTNREYIICGTNAFNPICGEYTITDGVLERQKEFVGRGTCPFNYRHNSTSVYVDDQLYVGTVSDFSGLDPLIYSHPLRTQQYDLSKFNTPNFVSSFALGDYVYFFFRETAMEYMNCGKATFSRVARVCRHDKGGKKSFRSTWTSYLKSRLNCSVAGDFPFYFNELQATSEPVEGRYGGNALSVIYGVFTTPENSISGSAVCAFTFQDIMDTFEGSFKAQTTANANWLRVPESRVPEPRPGMCVQDSWMIPDATLNFTRANSLMDEAVPTFYNQPILISTNAHSSGRFTSIEVDPQVKTPDGKNVDVLFIGTDNGKVLKAINTQSYDSYQRVEPFIIEELEVFEPGTAIISLKIIRPRTKDPRLLVTSSSEIRSIPLWRCNTDTITVCGDCLALRDPYCIWDKSTHKCRGTNIHEDDAIQSVASGTHSECKGEPITETDQEDGDLLFDFNEIVVNPKEKIQLKCGTKGEYRYCVWEKGTEIYQVEDVYEGVYSSMGRPENREGNQCGIVVEQAAIEDHGNWTCKIYTRGTALTGTKNVVITGAHTPTSRSVLFAP